MGEHTVRVDDRDGDVSGDDAAVLVAHVATLLRQRGERMTGPRKAVLTVLARHSGHLSAEQVVASVSVLDPAVHRASVYRTLDALTGLGVVQHLHTGHGGTAYHLADGPGAHLHAQCHTCGALWDLPADLLDAVAGRLARETGFVLDPTHVALSGTCAACRSAGHAQSPPTH